MQARPAISLAASCHLANIAKTQSPSSVAELNCVDKTNQLVDVAISLANHSPAAIFYKSCKFGKARSVDVEIIGLTEIVKK